MRGSRLDGLALAWAPFAALSGRDVHDVLALRSRVFVLEQRCLYDDVDGRDPDARHLLARDTDGALVGCLRVLLPGVRFPAVTIGRVAVCTEARGRGVASAMLEYALDRIRTEDGAVAVMLAAQAHLVALYARAGFEVVSSAPYDEDGIPHVDMRRPAPQCG